MDEIVVSLDIGSTFIRVVIGEFDLKNQLHIVGWAKVPSRGVRKGVITNIEDVIKAFTNAIQIAEQMAGRTVTMLYTGLAGGNIECYNSRGVVAVNNKGQEITSNDVDKVLEAAQAIAVPLDRKILHSIPQEYIIDGQTGIISPINMIGVRLEVEVHIVTCSLSSTDNIIKCVNRGNYFVKEIVLESLAVAECVLTKDERELGVLLIDIGGGTTDILLHYGGAPYFTKVLQVGGDIITNDISQVLNTPFASAETIKLRDGCCVSSYVEDSEEIIVQGVAGRSPRVVPKKELAEIIEARVSEIIRIIGNELKGRGYENKFPGGVVLTGGSSLLQGLADLTTEVLGVQARIGRPQGVSGLTEELRHPGFSTAVGLVVYGGERTDFDQNKKVKKEAERAKTNKENIFKKVFKHFI